ncbi:MAG: hypothetical protein CL772_04715 [Chloroflexi bacterium]|nr:hypothetical protein [Chloroflexota bacterium]MBK90463.1 hypothetical protein [Chloroflexota bacterium]|tara:strand:+ start:97576 stop:97854 length:279 start_codon:yes stop_codon:yes gene_type:complete
MNIFGIGGFELLLILLIAFFIVGPSNLLIFIRKTKIIYSEFKQKRDELISVVEQTIEIDDDIEELKNIKESLSDVSDKTTKSINRMKKDLEK